MAIKLTLHGVNTIKFDAWRYRERLKPAEPLRPGGWLTVEFTMEHEPWHNSVTWHTDDAKLMDHFCDIARVLHGALRREAEAGAGEADGCDPSDGAPFAPELPLEPLS